MKGIYLVLTALVMSIVASADTLPHTWNAQYTQKTDYNRECLTNL